MTRYRLLVEYDGRPYKGFQAQGALPTVQRLLELGFAVDTRDDQGATALLRACGAGHREIAACVLDAGIMHEAAQCLIGTHDFTTFRDIECQAKSPVKTLDIARVRRFGEEIHLVFAARSFLHRQVRSMTGTLVEAGLGRWDIADVTAALKAADRTACGQVAPPHGLCLTHVTYEAEPNFEKYASIKAE